MAPHGLGLHASPSAASRQTFLTIWGCARAWRGRKALFPETSASRRRAPSGRGRRRAAGRRPKPGLCGSRVALGVLCGGRACDGVELEAWGREEWTVREESALGPCDKPRWPSGSDTASPPAGRTAPLPWIDFIGFPFSSRGGAGLPVLSPSEFRQELVD